MKFVPSPKNNVMSNPNDPLKLHEDKSASTSPAAPSQPPKPPKGLLYELIMKATHEYNETVAARRMAELAKIYPSLND
jgi:hypothetical protein